MPASRFPLPTGRLPSFPRDLLLVAIAGAAAVFCAAPIAQAAVSTDSLVGYWKFDEGTGTLAADSSGHGNNGTAVVTRIVL